MEKGNGQSAWRIFSITVASHPRLKAVKLLPAYHGYKLHDAEELFVKLSKTELVVIVQTRLEIPNVIIHSRRYQIFQRLKWQKWPKLFET